MYENEVKAAVLDKRSFESSSKDIAGAEQPLNESLLELAGLARLDPTFGVVEPGENLIPSYSHIFETFRNTSVIDQIIQKYPEVIEQAKKEQEEILSSPVFIEALENCLNNGIAPQLFAEVLARALINAVVGTANDPSKLDGSNQLELVARLTARLLPVERGFIDLTACYEQLKSVVAGIYDRSDHLRGHLFGTPEILDALRSKVEEIEDDIILVGHSLGGIIALDFLKEVRPQNIKMLVTIGVPIKHYFKKRTPLLRELPPWLNVYHKYDPIGNRISEVFKPMRHPNLVFEDHEIVSEHRLVATHTGKNYWENQETWKAILEFSRDYLQLDQPGLPQTLPWSLEPGDVWAVLVGIEKYKDHALNLPGPLNDTDELKKKLVEIGIPDEQILLFQSPLHGCVISRFAVKSR